MTRTRGTSRRFASALSFALCAGAALSAEAGEQGAVFCGASPHAGSTSIAVVGDKQLLVGTGVAALRALPLAANDSPTLAWSPDCSLLAVVSDRIRILDPVTLALRELAPLPAGRTFHRASALERALVWAPSGKRFALRLYLGNTRWREELVVVDVAGGGAALIALPEGEISDFVLGDDGSALVSLGDGRSERLVRATAAKTEVLTASYRRIALSALGAAPPVVVAQRDDLALVRIDLPGAREELVWPRAAWLAGLSADGRAAIVSIDFETPRARSAFASLPLGGGPLTRFTVGAGGGSIEVENLGFAPDAAFTVGEEPQNGAPSASAAPPVGLVIDTGRGTPRVISGTTPPSTPLPSGRGARQHRDVRAVRVSPDGQRAVLLSEDYAGELHNRGCDWSWSTSIHLVELALWPAPVVSADIPLRTAEHCAVE